MINYSNNEIEETIKQIVLSSELELSLQAVLEGLNAGGWNIYPVTYRNIIIGGIIRKENEIHVGINPAYQKIWNPRPYINSILYTTYRKYRSVRSYANKKDNRSIRWLLKLGFKIYGETEESLLFELCELTKFHYRNNADRIL